MGATHVAIYNIAAKQLGSEVAKRRSDLLIRHKTDLERCKEVY